MKLIHNCLFCQEANSHRIAARPERRRQFEKELVSFSEVALSLLTACWDFDELKEQVTALNIAQEKNADLLLVVKFT
jgi:hypothetical protein